MEMIKAVSPMRQRYERPVLDRLWAVLACAGAGMPCSFGFIRGIFAAVDWCSMRLKSA